VRLRRLQVRRLQMRLERLRWLWLRRLLRILGSLPLVLERRTVRQL
jgi:hypothetical protein